MQPTPPACPSALSPPSEDSRGGPAPMRRFGCGSSTGWHVDCPFCRHVTEGAWLKTWGVEFFQYDYRASTIIVLSTKEPNNYVEGVRICLTKRPCLTAPLLRSQCSFRPVTSQRVSRAWGGGAASKVAAGRSAASSDTGNGRWGRGAGTPRPAALGQHRP
jgi:hypothetical protein